MFSSSKQSINSQSPSIYTISNNQTIKPNLQFSLQSLHPFQTKPQSPVNMQLPKASIIITLLTLVSGIAAQNIFDERDVDDVRLDARDLYIRDLESELAARDANEAQMKYLEQRVSTARTGLCSPLHTSKNSGFWRLTRTIICRTSSSSGTASPPSVIRQAAGIETATASAAMRAAAPTASAGRLCRHSRGRKAVAKTGELELFICSGGEEGDGVLVNWGLRQVRLYLWSGTKKALASWEHTHNV